MKFFLKYIADTPLDQISEVLVEDYLFDMKIQKNWSAKTIKNELGYLKVFFQWCVDRNYIETNPASKIPAPKLPKQLPKSLSQDDAEMILSWARSFRYEYAFEKHRAVAIIATFIFAGIRRGELENLMLGDIDLKERSIFIRCGKGSKDRIIPMAPPLVRIYEQYLKERDRLGRKSGWFFVGLRRDNKIGEHVIMRLVHKLRDASGIYFYPHMLRHTFATLMLDGGVNLFDLSKMMGHSDIKTTTIYLSTSIGRLKNQIVKHPMNF